MALTITNPKGEKPAAALAKLATEAADRRSTSTATFVETSIVIALRPGGRETCVAAGRGCRRRH